MRPEIRDHYLPVAGIAPIQLLSIVIIQVKHSRFFEPDQLPTEPLIHLTFRETSILPRDLPQEVILRPFPLALSQFTIRCLANT